MQNNLAWVTASGGALMILGIYMTLNYKAPKAGNFPPTSNNPSFLKFLQKSIVIKQFCYANT